MKILAISLLVAGGLVFFTYGTLNPCGILKKEIAMQVQKRSAEEQGLYLLFGGFIERGIDSLSPLQCVRAMYEVKTKGYGTISSEDFNKYFKK